MKKILWVMAAFLLCCATQAMAASYTEVFSGGDGAYDTIDVYQGYEATFSFDLTGSGGQAVWSEPWCWSEFSLDPSIDETDFVVGETVTSATLTFRISSVDNPYEEITVRTGFSDGDSTIATETYVLGGGSWCQGYDREYVDLVIDLSDYLAYLEDGQFESIVLALDLPYYCAGNDFRIESAQLDVTTDSSGGTGGTDPVPEPATLFLLGSGLIGLVRIGKNRKKC